MDWELIFWCVLGALALIFTIGVAMSPGDVFVSRECLDRISKQEYPL